MTDPDTIIVFSKGDAFGLLESGRGGTALPVAELRQNLEAFTQALKDLLPSVAEAGGGFSLKTVSVAVGIDGKGHVGFLGTGVEVGAQATLTLTFNKP